jgi:hypothetical protein
VEAEMQQKEQRYKLKRATLLRNILIAAFFWCFLGGALLVLSAETSAFLQAENPDPFIFILGRLMLILVVLIAITFLIVNLTFILDFFSYIRVTPEGIEQRRSPLKYVKCTWSEVEKFGKFQLVNDVIYIKSPSRTGKSAELSALLELILPRQPFILLTGYEGWPEGSLKEALKKYVPKLFQTSSQVKSA